uniref:40S ribosomal protein S12 n=1 Tax=Pleurostomum flabellatum TaxID=405751 RepID=A0A7T0Q544_9EUKA|nr:40S ribosomal protein S12 [Pleurostomum flabellatum]QPL15625.1 40S ribosomal protein S12 [Pleurostomum flabellatum]
MITKNQLAFSYPRIFFKKKGNSPRLYSSPQKKGTVLKVLEQSPKKPNSAKRKVAKVRLSTGDRVTCHLPGIGHNLQQHSVVLVQGGRCQDLIGVRYKPIRGLFDFLPVQGRKTRPSKYGVKGNSKEMKNK